MSNGHNQSAECRHVFSVSQRRIQPARPGNVDIEADSFVSSALLEKCWLAGLVTEQEAAKTTTDLHRISSSREKLTIVVTMDGNVENVRVFVKNLLRAIAVVNVLGTKTIH